MIQVFDKSSDYNYNDTKNQSIPLDRNLVLFGLGGAGKSLVFNLMNQRWFVDYYLSEPSRTLSVYIIDSARGDQDADIRTIDNIYRNIQSLKLKYPLPGTITINYAPITAEIVQASDLVSSEVRQNIKEWYKAEGMDHNIWWLEDPGGGLDDFFVKLVGLDGTLRRDFTGGVYRRRAISKALFYIQLAKGFLKNNFGQATISIVVGLGGGTGSGMFIDLARYLKSRCSVGNITLYGVLPSEGETAPEKQNAFSALSELEYMSLNETGVSTFSRVVLVPLDPTGYGGGHSSRLSPPLEEFSEMFNYIIASTPALNNPTADDKCKRYSAFILATGGVLKYSVDIIRKTRVQVGNLPGAYSYAIAAETKFRLHLNNMLENFSKAETEGALTVEDLNYLKKCVDRIRFWNNKAFVWMKYSSVNHLKNRLPVEVVYTSQNESYRSSRDILSDLNAFKEVISALRSQSEKDYIDDNDKLLIDVFSDAVALLQDSVYQLLLISSLDTPHKNTLKSLARLEDVDSEVIRTIRKEIDGKRGEIKHNKDLLIDTRSKLHEIDKLPENADRESNEILESYRTDLKKREIFSKEILGSIDEAESALQTLLSILKSPKIDFRFSKQSTLDDWKVYTGGEFGKLKGKLSHEGFVDFLDLVQKVIEYYYYIHMRGYFDNKVHDNLLKRSLNVVTGVKKELLKNSSYYNSRANEVRSGINDRKNLWGLEWTSPDLDDIPHVELNIKSGVQVYINQYLLDENSRIAREISQKVKFDQLYEDMLQILADPHESYEITMEKVKKAVESSILKRDKYSEKRKPLVVEEEMLSKMIEKSEEELRKLSEIFEIENNSKEDIGKIRSKWDSIQNEEHEINVVLEWIKSSQGASGEEYTFAKKIINLPSDIMANSAVYGNNLGEVANSSNIGEATSANVIRQMISDIQSMVVTKLFEPRYLGISRMNIGYGRNNLERWSPKNVIITMHSTFGDLNSNFCNNGVLGNAIFQKISGAHVSWNTLDHASPWDVGVTVFVMPLFLDNIMNIESLRNAFDSRMSSIDTKNILHSVLFLEAGKFIDKRRGINAPRAAEISKSEIEGVNQEVCAHIAEEVCGYHELVGFTDEPDCDSMKKEIEVQKDVP